MRLADESPSVSAPGWSDGKAVSTHNPRPPGHHRIPEAHPAPFPVKPFTSPAKLLDGLQPDQAASLLAAAADVALVMDRDGVIRDVSFGSEELSREGYAKWVGQPWIDTVTPESRPKVEAMLRDASATATTKGRHVNHPSVHGADVPVLYSALRLGGKGQVIAIGRDLRALAALQARLVEAQQSMERDYWRLRQVETRYRLLFQMSSEAILVVDAAGERVAEANPAAGLLLGESVSRVVGRPFAECFDSLDAGKVASLIASARVSGKAEDIRVRLTGARGECEVTASLFRHEKSAAFFVRLALPLSTATARDPKGRASILAAMEELPDAFVLTDAQGLVVFANAAFQELAQVASEEQAKGESLDRWLGRPGVDLQVLLTNLKQHGSVRLFSTTVRSENGVSIEVEICAAAIPSADPPALGFAIRNVGRRLPAEPVSTAVSTSKSPVPRSVEQMKELVGRVPLREIVGDSTDLIERLCIQAALELTRDNRASAAEMLGLSRQSLYVKLRRYGLSERGAEAEG